MLPVRRLKRSSHMTALMPPKSAACHPRSRIPDRMKVLYVTTLHRSSAWLSDAFATDSAAQVVVKETVGATAGLARIAR